MNKARRFKAKRRRKDFQRPEFVSQWYFTHACDMCVYYWFYDWHRCFFDYENNPDEECFIAGNSKRCNKFKLNLELMK